MEVGMEVGRWPLKESGPSLRNAEPVHLPILGGIRRERVPFARSCPSPPLPKVRDYPSIAAVFLLVVSSPSRSPLIAHSRRRLVYGSDKEGGAPYIYPDPENPRDVTGFEVELMRDLVRDLSPSAVFSQGQWDRLLQNLDAGLVDVVINGYEWTETRARDYLATLPYYVYQLQLMARRGGPVRSWDDLTKVAA